MKKIFLFLGVCFFFFGCTVGERRVGESKSWDSRLGQVKTGVTTEDQLIQLMGPPSLMDVKNMSNRTVYYYWMERLQNKSLYLFFYNHWDIDVQYDRAMFVFEKGVLQSYGTSRNVQ